MAKTKLCQIVAVVTGMKENAQRLLTEAHQKRLKPDLIAGLQRNYKAFNDEDKEVLPPENKRLQVTVKEVLTEVRAELIPVLDAVATQDDGNTRARADVTVGGKVVLAGLPVTYLLYLEHRLVDLIAFLGNLPVLDASEEWEPDPATGGYQTKPYDTLRHSKVMKTHIAHPATVEHPAQTQTYTSDVPVGKWTNVKLSGAVPASWRYMAVKRAKDLRDAIKSAREEANSMEVEQKHVGAALLDYVFGPNTPAAAG